MGEKCPKEYKTDKKNTVSLSCLEEANELESNRRPEFSFWDFSEAVNVETTSEAVPENVEEQEKAMVDDMLNILIGFDGRYIKANSLRNNSGGRTFSVSSNIYQPLISMVSRLLPAASDYSEVARFVDESIALPSGRVNQALGSIFSDELTDYLNDVLSLENLAFLDLNLMWSHLHKNMSRLKMMAQICSFIRKEKARGGCTLSILHSCTSNSLADREARSICLQWTKRASVPFFHSLTVWLSSGQLFDPYDEFMIIEKADRGLPLEISWEQKFQIRKELIPQFLESVATTILNAGKYMYCISRALDDFPKIYFSELTNAYRPLIGDLMYDDIDLVYISAIKRAHKNSNIMLRRLFDYDIRTFSLEDFTNITFIEEPQGDGHTLRKLEFAKSLFCIQYGDLFYNIFDKCISELQKPARRENFDALSSLVMLSIRNSSIGAKENEEFCSDVDVQLERGTLSWQVNSLLNVLSQRDTSDDQTLLEAMTLKLNVSWPLKMILDSQAMKFYQMIFRHIFYIKYVCKKLTAANIVGCRAKQALRYTMTIFLQTCLTYMTIDTVESKWEIFKTNYCSTINVLELVKEHKKYIYDVLTACMLTSSQMFNQLRHVLEVCLTFSENSESDCESEFETSLVTLIELADADIRWSSFSKTLIPIFTNYSAIANMNTDICSTTGDIQSTISVNRSHLRLDI